MIQHAVFPCYGRYSVTLYCEWSISLGFLLQKGWTILRNLIETRNGSLDDFRELVQHFMAPSVHYYHPSHLVSPSLSPVARTQLPPSSGN